MAQYPVDIKIDTGSADRSLNNLNSQLDQIVIVLYKLRNKKARR
jgi:hypothetical protein